MKKILFVCHGNICRSPMAEFVMKQKVHEAGLSHAFHIESAATSCEELGNPVYPPVRQILARHGIRCENKRARQIRQGDYGDFHHIIAMDARNVGNLLRAFGNDPERKIRRLMDFTPHPKDVADPWYTGDFQATWEDVNEGCEGLLLALKQAM